MLPLDRIDRAILHELQLDGRVSNVKLAERINLSESACLRRVKRLEDAGVIEGYIMLINQTAVGLPSNVFVEITLNRQQREDLDAFEARVLQVPEVLECYLMSGDYDYLLRVAAADPGDYERIHHEQLTSLPGVARVRSSFALRKVTGRTELPLPPPF